MSRLACGLALALAACLPAGSVLADDADDDIHLYTETLLLPAPEGEGTPTPAAETTHELQDRQELGYLFTGQTTNRVYIGKRNVDWFYPLVQTNLTYFDAGADTRMGGQIAFGGFTPLTNVTALFANASVNMIEDGEQWSGTIGLAKQSSFTDRWQDRIGFLISYDQFTDTRFGSPYIGSFRYELDYDIGSADLGVRYFHTVTGARIQTPLANLGGVMGSQLFPSMEYVEAFVRVPALPVFTGAELAVGYNDVTLETVYRAQGTIPINERMAWSTNLSYGDKGNWGLATGFTIALGGATLPDRPRFAFGSGRRVASRLRSDLVVRANNFDLLPPGNGPVTIEDIRRAVTSVVGDEIRRLNDVIGELFEIPDGTRIDRGVAVRFLAQVAAEAEAGRDSASSGNVLQVNLPVESLRQGVVIDGDDSIFITQGFLASEAFRQQLQATFANANQDMNALTNNCPANFPTLITSGGQNFCCNALGQCIPAP